MQFLIRSPAGSGQMCVGRAMASCAITSYMSHLMNGLICLIFLHSVICLNFLDLSMVGNSCWAHVRSPSGCVHRATTCTHVMSQCARLDSSHTQRQPAKVVLCQLPAFNQCSRSTHLPAMQKQEQLGPDRPLPCPNLGVQQNALCGSTPYAQASRRMTAGSASALCQNQDGEVSGNQRPRDTLLQPLSAMMKEVKDDPSKGKATSQVTEHPDPCAHEAKVQATQSPGGSPSRHPCVLECTYTLRPANKMPPFQGVEVNLANVWRHDGAKFMPSGRRHTGQKQCSHALAQANRLCVWNLGRKAMTSAAQAMTCSSTLPYTTQSQRIQLLHLPAILVLCAIWTVICWAEWVSRPPITHARFTCRLRCGIYRRRPKVLLSEPMVGALRRWLRNLGKVCSIKFTFCQPASADYAYSPFCTEQHVSLGTSTASNQCARGRQVPSNMSTSRKWTEALEQDHASASAATYIVRCWRSLRSTIRPFPQHPYPSDQLKTPQVSLRSTRGHACHAEQPIPQYESPQKITAPVRFCASLTRCLCRRTLGLHKEDCSNYGAHHTVSAAEAGRKSGQGCMKRTAKLHAILVLFILLQCITVTKATLEPSVGGSADLRPPECPPYEALRHTEQIGAERNGQSTTTGNRHVTRPVRKRAFIRAQNRAARNGEAIYRGRRLTAVQMGVQQLNNKTPKCDHRSTSCPKKAFRYLCWNAGGLTMEKYQELKHWLNTKEAASFHLICIQETQWSNDSEFELGHWSVIHSGSGSRSGGLLCIIHRSLATPAQIKSQAPLSGRLLHIRLTTEPAIDLLILYQHSWQDNQAGRDKLLSQRADIWAKISGWIAAVPRRNLCCIMGDFNTEVRQDGQCIGRGTMSQREPRQRDWHMWSDMIKAQDLCLLNTWGKQGLQARTYVPANGRGGSQIDFIALRQIHLQPWCKSVKPFNLPFADVHGMRHVALTGQLPRPSLPRKAGRPNPAILTLRKAQRIMSQDPEVLQRMRQVLRAEPLQCHSGDISTALSQAWSTAVQMGDRARGNSTSIILPVLQGSEEARNQSQEVTGSTSPDKSALIRSLWQLRRQIQQSQQRCRMDMSSLLQRWRLACTYSIQSRRLSKECRLAKARKITKLVQEAEANGGASLLQVQRISKKIAPKTKTRKIQFRDDSGFPLSNQAELEMIRVYYNDLYNPNNVVDKQPIQDLEANHLSITLQEVQQALQKLPKNKALPKHHAPAILWATFSEEVAPLVYRDLSQWCTDMTQQLPHDWSNAQVCLMTKPNKPPHTPAALRPISLLPPVAKALAHIAAQRLQPYLQPLLEKFQQFAYVRGREVHDAIERAAAHCAHARVLMSTQQRSIHKLKEGVRCAPCRGGLTLSLDISKAFDKLPRHKIAEALDFAGVDRSLKSLILEIQAQATLEFHHHDHTAKIGTSSGVRQGCGLSPALWAIYTCLILHGLHQHMLPEQLTVFADDFLGQWIIRQARDIPLAIRAMETLISIIQEDGLEISADKTVVLDGLRGPDKGKILKPHIFKDPQKGRCLKLNVQGITVSLPIKDKHTYLGIILSYGPFEKYTLEYRIKQSWANFSRLLPVLRSRAISLQVKLQLWKGCVFATLRYGLLATGLPVQGQQLIRQHVAKQIRLVAKAPSFYTRECTHDLYLRLGVQDPITTLRDMLQGRIKRAEQLPENIKHPLLTQWHNLLPVNFAPDCAEAYADATPGKGPEELLIPRQATVRTSADKVMWDEASGSLKEITDVAQKQETCPHCGIAFMGLLALKYHITRKHPELVIERQPLNIQDQRSLCMKHALQGMPTCRHCLWEFSGWPQFCTHFASESCPILRRQALATEQTQAEGIPVPLQMQDDVQALIRQNDWEALARLLGEKHHNNLLNHCPICNQWMAKPQYVSRHVQKQHSWTMQYQPQQQEWLSAHKGTIRNPCKWCGAQLAKSSARIMRLPACPVLYQTNLLIHIRDRTEAQPGDEQSGTSSANHGRRAGASEPGDAAARELGEADPDTGHGHQRRASQTRGSRGRGRKSQPGQVAQGPIQRPARPDASQGTQNLAGQRSQSAARLPRPMQGHEQAPHEARGPARSGSLSERVHHVLQANRPQRHPRLSGACGSMERPQEQQTSGADNEPEGSVVHDNAQGASQPLGSHQARQDHGYTNPAELSNQGASATILGVSAGQQEHGHKEGDGADIAGGHEEAHRDVDRAQPIGPGDSEISLHQTPAGGHQNGGHPIRASGRSPHTSSDGNVVHPARRSGEQAFSQNAGTSLDQLLKLKLGNRSNFCYSNASFIAISWTHVRSGESLLGEQLKRHLQWLLTQQGLIHNWDTMPWKQMHREWLQPSRQHDAPEYIMFLQRHLNGPVIQGSWEARMQHEDVGGEVSDRGGVWPLLLDQPLPVPHSSDEPASTPQSLVDAWHTQASTHAISGEPPSVMAIQLNRFQNHQGQIRKSTVRVALSSSLSIPCFSHEAHDGQQGLHTRLARYQLQAVIMHIGATPTEGHYQAVLIREHRMYLSDDGRCSTVLRASQATFAETNAYVLLYSRMHG